MILQRETLPVRLHVSGVHRVYVTLSEDNQPMLPGVSPECGLHLPPLPSCPPPLPPMKPWSLQFVSAAAPLHRRAGRGGMLDDMNPVNMLRGGVPVLSARTPTHCHTVPFSVWSPLFLTHTRRPPVVFLATLRQIQTIPLKAEPKPTTIVCWIFWGAFPSCQFVQVAVKKTSWPT